MSGTRASTIRADVVAAMREVGLYEQAGSADRLQHLDVARLPGGARDRAFRVRVLTPPHRDELQTCDAFIIEFQIDIYYALAAGIDDRICADIERIWWKLETLQSRNAGINASVPSHVGVETGDSNQIVRLLLRVQYRLDSALIA